MGIFSNNKKSRGIFSRRKEFDTLLKGESNLNLIKIFCNLDFLENSDDLYNIVTKQDIKNFVSKKSDSQSKLKIDEKILDYVLNDKLIASIAPPIPIKYQTSDVELYSYLIEAEYIQFLIKKHEKELKKYLVERLQYRYLKSVRKSKKRYRQNKSILEIPLLFRLLKYNDFVENIKSVKHFFNVLNNCFTTIYLAFNVFKNGYQRQHEYHMFSLGS
ncbi:MAG: hypothetical protein ACOYXB_14175 [Bacteroidota bacterium]